MHPPLDRPHPDCQGAIDDLKECHLSFWNKYSGGCNDIKVRLDQCLKAEKKRLLDEMNQDLPQMKVKQEEIIKNAFGKNITFSEYLAKDKDYKEAMDQKRQGQ